MSRHYEETNNRNNRTYNRSTSSRSNGYVYGSAALYYDRNYEQRRHREYSREAQRPEQNTQTGVSHFPLVLVTGMLVFLTVAVIYYVQLMAGVSTTNNNISSMQNQIKTLKTANDQRYEEINSSINFDQIKEIAINELGMKYADADQVVTYSNESDDYVHQVNEVGK